MVSEGLHLMLQMNMFRGLENQFGGISVAVRVLLSHDVRAACSSVMMIIMGRERFFWALGHGLV